jgi:hypothetical protein
MNGIAGRLYLAIPIGIGGSVLMDLWGLLLRRGFNVSTLDYSLLGRWIGHLPQGRLRHGRIADAVPVRGERPLGWVAHYTIGIVFAVLLLAVAGPAWAQAPTVTPALAVGVATIVAPWFVMQPAMGAGIAGAKTPSPSATRARNLGTHISYGIGTYATELVIASL